MLRYDFTVQDAQGPALQGVLAYVCTQPADTSTIPPSPLATLYTDSTGATQLANPVESDGLGNGFFYVPAGLYTIVYFDPQGRIPTTVFPDQSPNGSGGGGGGTVTSVGLTMPAEFSIAGSPVTTSGTLAVTKVNQNALTLYAGPLSGPAAAPTFKSVSSILAAAGVGSGTVTSVDIALSLPAFLSGSVSGNPITTSGVITITLGFANQAANTILAGPTSGGVGPVTPRAMVPADEPRMQAVAFSTTPTFDAGTYNSFSITLTGDILATIVTGGVAGQIITFVITQDATGNRSWVYPANFRGDSPIGTDPNSVSLQSFIYTGALWRAIGPGYVNSV